MELSSVVGEQPGGLLAQLAHLRDLKAEDKEPECEGTALGRKVE